MGASRVERNLLKTAAGDEHQYASGPRVRLAPKEGTVPKYGEKEGVTGSATGSRIT